MSFSVSSLLKVSRVKERAKLGIQSGQSLGFGGIDRNAVLDVRTIDAKKDDLPAALYGQLCSGTERYILKRYGWGVSLLWCILSASEAGQSSQRGSAAKCRRKCQKAPAA